MTLESFHAMLWFVWHTCSAKADFELSKIETAFWCSFKRVPNWRFVSPRYSFSQSPHGMEYTTFVFCLVATQFLDLAKICPNVWKGFKATIIPQLFKTLLIGSASPWMYVTIAKPFEYHLLSNTFSHYRSLQTVIKEISWIIAPSQRTFSSLKRSSCNGLFMTSRMVQVKG